MINSHERAAIAVDNILTGVTDMETASFGYFSFDRALELVSEIEDEALAEAKGAGGDMCDKLAHDLWATLAMLVVALRERENQSERERKERAYAKRDAASGSNT
jgi:hypothetical protein